MATIPVMADAHAIRSPITTMDMPMPVRPLTTEPIGCVIAAEAAPSAEAGAPAIEITPAMVDAASDYLVRSGISSELPQKSASLRFVVRTPLCCALVARGENASNAVSQYRSP